MQSLLACQKADEGPYRRSHAARTQNTVGLLEQLVARIIFQKIKYIILAYLGRNDLGVCGDKCGNNTYRYLASARVAQVTYDTSRNRNSVLVITRQVISHAAFARVHETAAEGFFVNFFPRRGFDQRRPSQEYTPLFTNDDVLVRHRRNISAARDGDAVHDSDLGYPKRGHLGLRPCYSEPVHPARSEDDHTIL